MPKDYVFLNYLRCHDDIGWGLDYDSLRADGMNEIPHKKYLNDYFLGYAGGSNSRGELYNSDPTTGDARFCGTTASMCGIEVAIQKKDDKVLEKSIQLDLMLHAYMFMQSGIPMLYSGDEIAQLNDNEYHNVPEKAPDSRYIHRGKLPWDKVKNIKDTTTTEGKVFQGLQKLEEIRRTEKVFYTNAGFYTIETWTPEVLCICRTYEDDKLIGIFNFSEYDKTAWINETDGEYVDLLTGNEIQAAGVQIPAYGFYYLKRK